MAGLPAFKVLPRSEQPPGEGYHVLLVHRISDDKRSVVHEISGRVPPSRRPFVGFIGENAFTGSPGDALRMADGLATKHRAPVVYVRDDTSLSSGL